MSDNHTTENVEQTQQIPANTQQLFTRDQVDIILREF